MKSKSGMALTIALYFVLSTLGSVAATFSFTNSSAIALNTVTNPLPVQGSVYPSTISVSGLSGLQVGKVTVTLNGFIHSYPSDVYVLLVGPHGQEGLAMAAVGGIQQNFPVTNAITLTLDDDAASALPANGALSSGVFKPTNGYLTLGTYTNLPKDFPPPAPSGNSNAVPALKMFKNTDPNGTWNLFTVDDGWYDTGGINGGWTLNITAGVPLSFYKTPTNMVVSWTNAVSGCVLQSVPHLSSTWSNVTAATVNSGGHFWVTNPINGGSGFFRLVK